MLTADGHPPARLIGASFAVPTSTVTPLERGWPVSIFALPATLILRKCGPRGDIMMENDPLWYKDAIVYEVPVKSFHDSNEDGIGDFRGLAQKLDYLQDLGVTAVWILPFYPSPLRDDGYDIADYSNVHPQYGKLRDFRDFLAAAHARGIRVITELVINHTS